VLIVRRLHPPPPEFLPVPPSRILRVPPRSDPSRWIRLPVLSAVLSLSLSLSVSHLIACQRSDFARGSFSLRIKVEVRGKKVSLFAFSMQMRSRYLARPSSPARSKLSRFRLMRNREDSPSRPRMGEKGKKGEKEKTKERRERERGKGTFSARSPRA